MDYGTIFQRISQEQAKLTGKTAFYYQNLLTGESFEHGGHLPLIAASVIKIPIMVEFFYQIEEERISPEEVFTLRAEDKMPSCGALTYMHDGLRITALDLCTLMIILSDNTATNLLIKRLGMERINQRMQTLGASSISLSRLLFDGKAQRLGLENRITACDIGLLLSMMYHSKLPGSRQMLNILRNQRLNGKIPFFLHGVPIAHKTGEDDGITHDVGIVYTSEPFIVCFLSEETDVPTYERWIQDTTFLLASLSKPQK